MVKGFGTSGAILNVAGYTRCAGPMVVNPVRREGREVCVLRPFAYRLAVPRGTSAVAVRDAGPVRKVQLARFQCAPGYEVCLDGVLPNGAPEAISR